MASVAEKQFSDFQLSGRTLRALDTTDNMPKELRECVHEFGYAIVHAMKQAGVSKPSAIRQLVHEVWMGARQPNQRNQIGRSRSPVQDQLDWVLVQAGAGITAATLLRVLASNNMYIIPRDPSTIMVEASMNAIKGMGILSRTEKHRIRLRAALHASAQRLWPHLFK